MPYVQTLGRLTPVLVIADLPTLTEMEKIATILTSARWIMTVTQTHSAPTSPERIPARVMSDLWETETAVRMWMNVSRIRATRMPLARIQKDPSNALATPDFPETDSSAWMTTSVRWERTTATTTPSVQTIPEALSVRVSPDSPGMELPV